VKLPVKPPLFVDPDDPSIFPPLLNKGPANRHKHKQKYLYLRPLSIRGTNISLEN